MKSWAGIFTVLWVLLFFNSAGKQKPKQVVREPVVAGTFYPSAKTELKKQLDDFFEAVENKAIDKNIRE